jgi:hypothetical protein
MSRLGRTFRKDTPCASVLMTDVSTPSTYPSTKLRETERTRRCSDGLSKPEWPYGTAFVRYRTQEVAGSSPASSTHETPAKSTIRS